MQISCPKCSKEIPTADLNMQHMIAKCTSCGEVFNFTEQVRRSPKLADISQEPLQAPRPEKVHREHDGFHLKLSWRWYSPIIFFLIPFALFWNFVVCSFVSFSAPLLWGPGREVFNSEEGFPNVFSIFSFFPLFATPHALIGLGLIYYILSLLLNKTTVNLTRSEVSVHHGPMPWYGAKAVAASDIDQLYAKERVGGRRGTQVTYEVHMIDRQNTHRKLVSGLDSPEHALYVEQEIEAYLEIENRHVRGAY